jgi:hypothetical membrane protein
MSMVAFGCIGVAIFLYPEFSWFGNALSDLGVVSGVSAPVFNFGLFVAGLLFFFFVIFGLFSYFKNDGVLGRMGSAVFAVAAICLMAIGVFNESFWPMHFIVAVSFFITLSVALLILTAVLYRRREFKLAIFTLVSSFVVVVPWIFFFFVRYVPNVAIPEAISSFVGSFCIGVISYKILKTTKP